MSMSIWWRLSPRNWKASGGWWWHLLVVVDFYIAAGLLLTAGVLKAMRPGISELLEYFLEQGVFPLTLVLFLARWQSWFEIVIALVALSGWQARWSARGLAVLYLLFAVLIGVAADGYWLSPIDCGCFGSEAKTPAYLLIIRNCLIAFPLFFAGPGFGVGLLSRTHVAQD